jgi:hypothetical protein
MAAHLIVETNIVNTNFNFFVQPARLRAVSGGAQRKIVDETAPASRNDVSYYNMTEVNPNYPN